ncbi:MAG: hypothetical protein ACYTEK_09820 [Planctomycetota bacterium]
MRSPDNEEGKIGILLAVYFVVCVIIGTVAGGIYGFEIGGVGGAILGILCGAYIAFVLSELLLALMGSNAFWIFPALIILLLIYLLWGVGKP